MSTKIGVFVSAICHDGNGKVLLGKRGGAARDNHGIWEFGGGGLEFGETLEEGIKREFREEFGTEPFNVKQIHVREFIETDSHVLGVFFSAQIDRAQVRIAEPAVYDEIGWFTLDTIPSPLMAGDHEWLEYYLTQR